MIIEGMAPEILKTTSVALVRRGFLGLVVSANGIRDHPKNKAGTPPA